MKKIISTSEAPAAVGPYSQAIRIGNLVFCSGQIPLDPETGEMENIAAVLRAERLSFDNIIKTTIFLANLADFQAVNELYGSYFKSDPPARSTVQVAALPKNAQVEIEVVAATNANGGRAIDTWE